MSQSQYAQNGVQGLDAILTGGGGTQFITFKEGSPMTLLILDWYEKLNGVREHYEPALNPKYIRCPGKDVCPLCHANPSKYPSLRIKFRVYDPQENKVKLVSLSQTHIKKLNADFNLDGVNPTQQYVTIYRTGSGASDTSYSARLSQQQFAMPDWNNIEIPDIAPQLTPHTPDEIQGFMNAVLGNVPPQQPTYGGGYPQQGGFPQQQFGGQPSYGGQPQAPQQQFGGQVPQPQYGGQPPVAPQTGQQMPPQQHTYDPSQGQPQQGVNQDPSQGAYVQQPPRNLPF